MKNHLSIQADLARIDDVCAALHALIEPQNHAICVLQGDIGAGKTSFVAHYARFIGLKEYVTSPTFSLLHQYGKDFFHYDLFNRTLEEALNCGILDLLESAGVHFVEWGEEGFVEIIKDAFSCVKIIAISKCGDCRIYHIS